MQHAEVEITVLKKSHLINIDLYYPRIFDSVSTVINSWKFLSYNAVASDARRNLRREGKSMKTNDLIEFRNKTHKM